MTSARWIFRLSFRQLVQRKRAVALALLTALPGIVLAIASVSVDEDELVGLFHDLNVGLYLLVGLAVTGLLTASSAFGEELRSSTISYIVVKPVPRWVIAAAVTVAATSATLLLAGIGLAIITIGDAGLGLAPLVALFIEAFGYSAVFVPLGLLFSRATLAGLAYIFVWEGILARAISALAPSSVSLTAFSGYADLAEGVHAETLGFLGNLVPGAGGAIAKVLVAYARLLAWLIPAVWEAATQERERVSPFLPAPARRVRDRSSLTPSARR
jgi:ABC-2 type transport system permease protein